MTINRPKLTANQKLGLQSIAAGQVTLVNTGTAAFRIRGEISPQVVGRLVAMKLARWPKGYVGNQACEITDAGRAAISEAQD